MSIRPSGPQSAAATTRIAGFPRGPAVYSTLDRAEARLASARTVRGFRRYQDSFIIDPYDVDQDHWESGFDELDDSGEPIEGPDAPTSPTPKGQIGDA